MLTQNSRRFSVPVSLDVIQIKEPCHESWDLMSGDERTRFCGSCRKNVYDVSEMTREAALALIAEKEGDVCMRLHRRADGTVLTADCGKVRARFKRALAFCSWAVGISLAAFGATRAMADDTSAVKMGECTTQPGAAVTAGIIALPSTRATTQPTPEALEIVPRATPTTEPTDPPVMGKIAPQEQPKVIIIRD